MFTFNLLNFKSFDIKLLLFVQAIDKAKKYH